ncbi:hypothetical protein [Sulfitobacter sp.]|uniref:hypothetical protein n=1 Tax=Sulfitobacter sp. TaxID=1903071 RepID=UPI0030015941
MSKPVTNEDVEDVLSSIRRLVSEDKRPLAGLSRAPREVVTPTTAETKPEAASGRLVLTPALRVAEAPQQKPEPETAPLDLGSVARRTWMQPDEPADTPDVAEDHITSKIAEPVERNAEPDAAMDALDALVHETLETQKPEDDEPLEDGNYSDETYWKADDAGPRPGEATVEAQLDAHEDEAPMAELVEDHHDDYGDDVDWDDGLEAETERSDAAEKSVPAGNTATGQQFFQPDQDDQDTQNINFGDLRAASIPLKATIAALGAAIGKTPQDWEPDGEEGDELSAADDSTMAWEDDLELDAKGEPLDSSEADAADEAITAKPEARSETPIGAAFGADDQVMDEEALRDLVSEIVRSELQGALGERITRNVRKLVRREIHRALTAQEME